MIDEAIRSILENTTALTNIVGTRIYNTRPPQDAARPLLVFSRVSVTDRALYHKGHRAAARTRVQFSCLADSALQAKRISAAVRGALHGYSGTVGGDRIFIAQAVSEVDLVSEDLGFMVALDIVFTHAE